MDIQPAPSNLKPVTTMTVTKAPPALKKWCDKWNRLAAHAGVKATMTAREVGRPSMGRVAFHLMLARPGVAPVSYSFKGLPLEALTKDELMAATLSLMLGVGLAMRNPETRQISPTFQLLL